MQSSIGRRLAQNSSRRSLNRLETSESLQAGNSANAKPNKVLAVMKPDGSQSSRVAEHANENTGEDSSPSISQLAGFLASAHCKAGPSDAMVSSKLFQKEETNPTRPVPRTQTGSWACKNRDLAVRPDVTSDGIIKEDPDTNTHRTLVRIHMGPDREATTICRVRSLQETRSKVTGFNQTVRGTLNFKYGNGSGQLVRANSSPSLALGQSFPHSRNSFQRISTWKEAGLSHQAKPTPPEVKSWIGSQRRRL